MISKLHYNKMDFHWSYCLWCRNMLHYMRKWEFWVFCELSSTMTHSTCPRGDAGAASQAECAAGLASLRIIMTGHTGQQDCRTAGEKPVTATGTEAAPGQGRHWLWIQKCLSWVHRQDLTDCGESFLKVTESGFKGPVGLTHLYFLLDTSTLKIQNMLHAFRFPKQQPG